MTAFNSKEGGFYKTTVGRVQTPTLAILVEREDRIRSFKARDYGKSTGRCRWRRGEYAGRWFDESSRRQKKTAKQGLRGCGTRSRPRPSARSLGKSGVATEEAKPVSQLSPLLYDLTSLQREANGRFGFSRRHARARTSVVRKAQGSHLSADGFSGAAEDYLGTVKKTLDTFAAQKASDTRRTRPDSQEGLVKPNRRVFDNKKISDHFAIIPTMQLPRHLSEGKRSSTTWS